MSSSLLARFRRYTQQLRPATSADAVRKPLLDDDELQQLANLAEQSVASAIHFERHVASRQLGDYLSRFRGQGLEFEENRRYQPGDEQRLINWRLYARRGELFSKVFVEERRPEVFLLVDRRASMRFATRNQLKVKLAARLAMFSLFQAQRQAIRIGGVVLDSTASWHDARQGRHAEQALLNAISAPCPPLSFNTNADSLQQQLNELDLRLAEGSFVLLLSDFADLDPASSAGVLRRLAIKHTMLAIQILDPVETHLPPLNHLLIDDPLSEQPINIDGRDPSRQAAYADAFARQQATLEACFAQCQIPLFRCYTSDRLQDCLNRQKERTRAS